MRPIYKIMFSSPANSNMRAVPALVLFFITLFTIVSFGQSKSVLLNFSSELQKEPITGRMFIFISTSNATELRTQRNPGCVIFATDVSALKPGEEAEITEKTLGYPLVSLNNFPAGDYYIQGLLNVYTEFHRADGHTIWAHMDQWEGQKYNVSPGNFYSEVQKIHLDPAKDNKIKITLTKKIPPIKVPEDTKWVKRVKIKSEILTKFWGHPFYIGATLLLPKGYDEHPDVYYPVEYEQTHFTLGIPHGLVDHPTPETPEEKARRIRNYDETGYEFFQQWTSETFPRMICVTFQHPTPYYDDSYAVNSANNGPYGDAIMQELIPYLEEHFRMIREPYARVIKGGSTGGWETLALQVYHPDFFGSSWTYYPDPIDFRCYGLINIYEDENAFYTGGGWAKIERPMNRAPNGLPTNTFKLQTQLEEVLGSKGRSGEQLDIWEAVYGPTDEEGYPKPLWDRKTGVIDHSVANYMKEHNYDLRYYMETNWSELGPKLAGKMHFLCGDMDGFYLNLGVYKMEEFLEKTTNPYYGGTFQYGRPLKGHGWTPYNNYQAVKVEADYVQKKAEELGKTIKWNYK